MLKIRIHHFLCLRGFQGKGYNKEFISNMGKVFELSINKPEVKVQVIVGIDDICSACPYRQENVCVKRSQKSHSEKMEKERELLKFLEISENSSYQIKTIFQKIRKKIPTKQLADELWCRECEWHDDCLWRLKLK